ncbi:MAG: MotA/TolQ/ExbB proton channel family protein [Lacunisphaera sp.]
MTWPAPSNSARRARTSWPASSSTPFPTRNTPSATPSPAPPARKCTASARVSPTLDTCITAAPLLGLLGTVTGMMGTFAALNTGGGDIGSSTGAITGGVAEALIATMCGLGIAITGLLPFNYLNARLEEARHEVEDASNSLEIIINKSSSSSVR